MTDFETHAIGTSNHIKELENKLEQYERHDGMEGAIVHAIRELLYSQNVPKASYIDDHVANAIIQRNIAIDALKKQKELWDELAHNVSDPKEPLSGTNKTVWDTIISNASVYSDMISKTLLLVDRENTK